MTTRKFLATLLGVAFVLSVQAQNPPSLGGRQNIVPSAVPFLSITPDSRAGGMADAGLATTPDANSMHHNPSKIAFVEDDYGFSLSYTPWLRALNIPDINLSYLSAYSRIDEMSAITGSLRYFDLGDIQFTDEFGSSLGEFRPYELALDVGYARKLSEEFSVAVALRYIHSNLAGNLGVVGGVSTQPGNAVAGDISLYWQKDEWEIGEKKIDFALGANIRNLGSKITYTDETQRDFLPANLGIGTKFNMHIDDYNEIAFMFDINKLLVPTPPVYSDSARTNDNAPVIESGQDPDVPVMQGVIQSFYDAPGGFSEEIREINPTIALEYWYVRQFAVRMGYFYEHPTKGNRQFLTVGAGIRYNVFGLDFAYLFPTNANRQAGVQSPLQNTLRITMTLNFNKDSNNKEDSL